jgi:hypothetical protein
MSWLASVITYADLISGVFGILAATVLAYPAVNSVRAKRNWEGAQRLRRDQVMHKSNAERVRKITDRVSGVQLGGAAEMFACSIAGYVLLFLSFVFLIIAAADRHRQAVPTADIPLQKSAV